MNRLSALAVAVATLGACGNEEDPALPIGVLMPSSGGFSFGFTAEVGAMDTALAEINEAGGILGEQVRFDVRDSNSGEDEDTIARNMNGFAADGVPVVLGGGSSASTGIAIPLAVENETLLISGVAARPSLSDLDEADLFFRTTTTADFPISAAGAYFEDEGFSEVAILYLVDDLQEVVASLLAADVESREMTVSVNASYAPDARGLFDVSSQLQQVYAANPDVLYLAGTAPDATEVLEAWDKSEWNGRVVGGPSLQQSQLADTVGTAKIEGVEVISGFNPSGPDFERFRERYIRFNRSNVDFFPYLQTCWYDATAVAALAIEAAGSYDAIAVRDQLRRVANPPGEVIEAGQLARGLELLSAGVDINYEGMGSNTDFDENGEVPPNAGLWRFANGEFAFIRAFAAEEL